MDRLHGGDAGFLYIESPTQVSTITCLFELAAPGDGNSATGPVTVDDLRQRVTSRLAVLPAFRKRLRRIPLGLHHPLLIDDPEFDLEYHLRHVTLPTPGRAEDLDRLVAADSSRRMDRRHPLWRITLVDGLEKNRQALIFQFHHCLFDGVALQTTFNRILDPDLGDPTPPVDWDLKGPTWLAMLVGALGDQRRSLRQLPALVKKTRLQGKALKARRAATPFPVPKSLVDTPPTSLNNSYNLDRVYARAHVSIADIRLVQHEAGVTFNDVILAMAGGAFRRHLDASGEHPDRSLTVNVPVSSEARDAPPRQWGNQFSNLLSTLATDIDDPWERLLTISIITEEARRQLDIQGVTTAAQWLEYAAPFFAEPAIKAWATMRRRHPEKAEYSTLVSNVRGTDCPRSLGGLPVDRVYLSGPPFDGSGVNVTVFTMGDQLTIAILANPSALENPADLAHGFTVALGQLVELAHG